MLKFNIFRREQKKLYFKAILDYTCFVLGTDVPHIRL